MASQVTSSNRSTGTWKPTMERNCKRKQAHGDWRTLAAAWREMRSFQVTCSLFSSRDSLSSTSSASWTEERQPVECFWSKNGTNSDRTTVVFLFLIKGKPSSEKLIFFAFFNLCSGMFRCSSSEVKSCTIVPRHCSKTDTVLSLTLCSVLYIMLLTGTNSASVLGCSLRKETKVLWDIMSLNFFGIDR